MADFYTTNHEENLINRIIGKDGLDFNMQGNDLPKYIILRIAIARALVCKKLSLDSSDWENKKMKGERGKEYHLEQITGKGKDKNEDFDILLRAFFSIQHKEELENNNINIFEDEKTYIEILSKYIQRGLYEMSISFKSRDCFYQWLLDNLDFGEENLKQKQILDIPKDNDQNLIYFPKIQQYFKNFAIEIKLVNEEDSYRHYICKIELNDSAKINHFHKKTKDLDEELGFPVLIESCAGLSKTYNIQVTKPKSEHQNLGMKEYKIGLESLQKNNFALGVFAGMSVDKKPFCFDLVKCPHLFVAGTTGSGKSVFLQVMVATFLNNKNTQVIIIDPKNGAGGFDVFAKKAELIYDMQQANATLDSLIEEMESRYLHIAKAKSDDILALGFKYKIVIIDELNNLIENDKTRKDKIARLAEKARQAGIHLVLGTQRPDGKLLQGLRNNIPSSVVLKVQKASESKIILDEEGAEKLTDSGDMLVKISGKIKHIFGVYLSTKEMEQIIYS